MSERMNVAQAYEKALFAGDRDGVGGQFTDEMRDYTDSHVYEEFAERHRSELPKFQGT